MKHVLMTRQLVKIVFDEINHPTDPIKSSDNRPTVSWCKIKFKELNKSYDEKAAKIIFAIATGDGYLDYDKSKDSQHNEQRVRVKSDGLKLISSPAYLINALAGTVGSIAPIVISIIALLVSIMAIAFKTKG